MIIIIAGIDIGFKGAVVLLDIKINKFTESIYYPHDYEDHIVEKLLKFKTKIKAIIKSPQMFTRGSLAVQSLGITYGIYIAYLKALNIPFIEVRPID